MARKKTSQRKKNKKNKSSSASASASSDPPGEVVNEMNFLPEAGPGCHIVRLNPNQHQCTSGNGHGNRNTSASASTSTCINTEVLGWDEDIIEQDFAGQPIPDICFDPSEDGTSSTLTLCNISRVTKVAYVTVYEVDCFGKHGKPFQKGTTTDNEGNTSNVVTFIVLAPPMTFCTLCEIIGTSDPYKGTCMGTGTGMDVNKDITSTRIESDVQEWKPHPNPLLEYSTPLKGFPLAMEQVSSLSELEPESESESEPEPEPFLCTQGVNGQLTHYFLGNLHAVDFRCDIGTSLLAVEDGEVVQVKEGNTLTGICASNLFEWNSILIRHKMDHEQDENQHENQHEDEVEDEHKHDGTGIHNGSQGQEPRYFYTEYVHIQSATVREGDKVQRGDKIGYSGSVGFSPEPHLHFSVYLSGASDAPSVGFWFRGQGPGRGRGPGRCQNGAVGIADNCGGNEGDEQEGLPYRPIAGKRYDAFGQRS